LYWSTDIVRVVTSRRMRWTGLVARMRGREMHTVFWYRKLNEIDHLEDLGVDGRLY
jgi:hypothetical protein